MAKGRDVVKAVILAIIFFRFGPDLLSGNISKVIFDERCHEVWFNRNITALRASLQENVFGQHIAIWLVLSALQRRWTCKEYQPEKPLVMSFHGWTGSGKNYVAKFIAEALFEKGLLSQSVFLLSSTLHFHDKSKVSKYREILQRLVRTSVERCPESLFIIDEVDKLPPGVLDGLKVYMDFHDNVDGVDFRRATFVLLSNTGGREITRKTMEFFERGLAREAMVNTDFEDLIAKGAFNEEGGLYQAAIIDKSLVDVYVPFLPLEVEHVRLCIQREIRRRGAFIGDGLVERVVRELSFWPKKTPIFSSSGCKRVIQKTDELLYEP